MLPNNLPPFCMSKFHCSRLYKRMYIQPSHHHIELHKVHLDGELGYSERSQLSVSQEINRSANKRIVLIHNRKQYLCHFRKECIKR